MKKLYCVAFNELPFYSFYWCFLSKQYRWKRISASVTSRHIATLFWEKGEKVHVRAGVMFTSHVAQSRGSCRVF